MAASVTAHPCRYDGDMVVLRLHVAVKTRLESRERLERGRYLRVSALVNLRRRAGRADKVDQMSRALRLLAATYLRITSSKHFFELEPNLRPLMKMTCSLRWPSAYN